MATTSLTPENRNDILARLDAERQQRRSHIISGKPFTPEPITDEEDTYDDPSFHSRPTKSNTDTRELLVLKLLEERRKSAARLQHQLSKHDTQYDTQHHDPNEFTSETEIEDTSERDTSRNDDTSENDDISRNEYSNFEDASGSDERLFHAVGGNARVGRSSNFENDIGEEDYEDHYQNASARPPPLPSNRPSSQPPPLPAHPSRAQNLIFLKQQIHQKQLVQPSQQQWQQRQTDSDTFDSAFKKIKENVYGRNNTNSEGYTVNGSWRGTIAFNQPPSASAFGSELDDFSSQLHSLDQPPSSHSHSLSRSSSSHSTHSMYSSHSAHSSHSIPSHSSVSRSSSVLMSGPSAPLSSFAPPLPSSARPAQQRRAARPSSAPPRPASTTPPNKAPPRKAAHVSFASRVARPSSRNGERAETDADREFQEKFPFEPNKDAKDRRKVVLSKQKLDMLAKSKKDIIAKREQEKKKQEQQELQKLSFKPVVNPLPPEYGNLRQQDDVPLVERLYHEADKKIALRAKAKNELVKEQLRGCSFKPNISKPPSGCTPAPEGVPQKPIYERLGDVQRQRREKLHKLKMQVEEEQKPTFAPYVNPLSRRMVESRNQSQASVHSDGEGDGGSGEESRSDDESRLTHSVNAVQPTHKHRAKSHTDNTFARLADMEIEQEKKYKKQEKWQRLLAVQYTFTPQVNANTEKILLQSDAFGNKIDFLDRLNFYKEKRKCAVMQAEPPRYTFQPYINPATKGMVEARQSRTGETEGDKYERLAFGDMQKRAQSKQQLEESIYSHYTFKPTIDKISSLIAPVRSSEELYRDERKEEHKRAAKQAAEEAFHAAYTFQPQLYSNPYNHIEPKHRVDIRNSDAISQNIKQMEEKKAMKIQKEKLAQQKREMAQCTFTPVVNHSSPPVSNESVTVRGLDRFLELKDMAKKLEDEKKEREENAFKVKASAVGAGGQILHLPFTIPAPFHFQTRNR